MKSDITVILTLYKTPHDKLKNLEQYKTFKTIIFEQEGGNNSKKKIEKNLSFKPKYYFSKKNIGLSKSSNFLLSKVKTRYCLFTQADISIKRKSILKLKKFFNKDKKIIFVGPDFLKIKTKKNFQFVKKINAACILCDVKKLKKIGFFDEEFFLYWEDIFLMNKINKSKYKMLLATNVKAEHISSQSSENNIKTKYIRELNFIYGELVYDYKLKKSRIIKVLRKLVQNISIFCINIVVFKFKDAQINLAKIIGILKYVKFLLIKVFNIFK